MPFLPRFAGNSSPSKGRPRSPPRDLIGPPPSLRPVVTRAMACDIWVLATDRCAMPSAVGNGTPPSTRLPRVRAKDAVWALTIRGPDLRNAQDQTIEAQPNGRPSQPLPDPEDGRRRDCQADKPIGTNAAAGAHHHASGERQLFLGARQQRLELGHDHQKHQQNDARRHDHQHGGIDQRRRHCLTQRLPSVEGFGQARQGRPPIDRPPLPPRTSPTPTEGKNPVAADIALDSVAPSLTRA